MKIDVHVHMVGNGLNGSGCWYRPRGWTRLGEPLMLKAFGLPRDSLQKDLETLYAERLLSLIQSSSLDAAVILAQEVPYEANGRMIEGKGSLYVPNPYVLGLAQAHPEFLAGISIHPARLDALEELERGLQGGAVLLKCLPNCQNIDWSDHRYTKFLERMAEAGLPLLCHTGGEHTLPVIAKHLENPRVLVRPLEIGVTCIAAHCGTTSSPFDPDYFDLFVELMAKYPRLYGDNSAFSVLTRGVKRRHIKRCLEPDLVGRILHGSDVPVPVLAHSMFFRGLISRRAFSASRAESNPIERDYQLKRALGFPEESFTQAARLLRLRHVTSAV